MKISVTLIGILFREFTNLNTVKLVNLQEENLRIYVICKFSLEDER